MKILTRDRSHDTVSMGDGHYDNTTVVVSYLQENAGDNRKGVLYCIYYHFYNFQR